MVRSSLDGLPPLEVPQGYEIRHFVDGDEDAWSRVYAAAFEHEYDPLAFARIMASDEAFLPERIWFAVSSGEPVATASAYCRPATRPGCGMIHYVGVVPEHRGRGLGRAVTLAALWRMVAEDHKGAWLSTDDHRIAAIRIYLDLGFEPRLVDEEQRERWRRTLEKVDPALPQAFAAQIGGRVFTD